MNKRVFALLILAVVGVAVGFVILRIVRPFILRPYSGDGTLKLTSITAGLKGPLYVTHNRDDNGMLFVVEQDGLIKIVANGAARAEPFLDVSGLVSRDGSERGLLGMAFHPDYSQNGYFYINYTALDGKNTIARYQVSSDSFYTANPDSGLIVLAVEDPYPNHNAGQLAFGPDGYLYIGMGDGGSAGDTQGNGQNPKALLGKMLRLDVNGSEPYSIPPDNPFTANETLAPEVWAWGLRNPWRYSFDRATGDLYIADVGQNQWEEVNFQPADSSGGENYGWNYFEGTHPYDGQPSPEGLVMPIAEYNHSDGCSVTGGYVYRGQLLPALAGAYVFGDFCSGAVWKTERDENGGWQTTRLMDSGRVISSFGEDAAGELYLVDYNGELLRFEPT